MSFESSCDDDLDLSWLDTHERLNDIEQNYFKESKHTIQINYVYININNYIDKIVSKDQELEYFDEDYMLFPKEQILKNIQHNKTIGDTKYQLLDILTYIVDIEPKNIKRLLNPDDDPSFFVSLGASFFNIIPLVVDIKIPKSIFIFHKINSIHFIFQEMVGVVKIPKPILKIFDGRANPRSITKKTKKVTIKTSHSSKTKRVNPSN